MDETPSLACETPTGAATAEGPPASGGEGETLPRVAGRGEAWADPSASLGSEAADESEASAAGGSAVARSAPARWGGECREGRSGGQSPVGPGHAPQAA